MQAKSGTLLCRRRNWGCVSVSRHPQDLANWVSHNGRTPHDLTELSVIPTELLLICIHSQLRIPVVTQTSGWLLVLRHQDFQLKMHDKAYAGSSQFTPQIWIYGVGSRREKGAMGRDRTSQFCKQIATTGFYTMNKEIIITTTMTISHDRNDLV